MSTIFISHSSRDNQMAQQLERRLAQQNHHSVFLDLDPEQGIVAGQSWEKTLYRKLRAARAVIALCTDHHLSSHWCFAEIALARMEGKAIFALLLDPLSSDRNLPAILTEKQFIDLRSDPETGFRRLWRGLEALDLLGTVGEWDPRQPPYLGLNAYQEAHAPLFFGRETDIRSGLELLNRGAPNLIMVLGASGSGKSSLVRAGILPRLRREADQWLIVDPFRPGQAPLTELAESLALAYRRYTPSDRPHPDAATICHRLQNPLHPRSDDFTSTVPSHLPDNSSTVPDARLHRLLTQLEDLQQSPPVTADSPLLNFLHWSLEDLHRICGSVSTAPVPAASSEPPFVDLVRQLQRRSEHRQARVLVVIDQFEELLGNEETKPAAQAFLSLLRAALEVEHSPLMVLGTMRSDFLGDFQHQPTLQGLDFESLSVGPMQLNGMRRVIEEPAKLGALELEVGLADRLLADTGTPDALPLLSFTLWVLWRDFRADGRLDVAEYESMGGLHGALAHEADVLLARAQRHQQDSALRQAFVQMARLSESGAYARQPVAWNSPDLQPVHELLKQFIECRLLAIRVEGEQQLVEVTHEAMFRTWTPLKNWLDEQRTDLLLKQQIHQDAQTWNARQRPPDVLWRGGRLLQAKELLARVGLTGCDLDFVEAGLRQRRRQVWTRWGIAATVVAVLTGCLGLALLYLYQAKVQEVRTYLALSNAHITANRGLEARVESIRAARTLQESLLIKLRPGNTLPNRVRVQLQQIFFRAPERHRIEAHQGTVTAIAFSQDGRWLATTGSEDRTARLWDLETGHNPVTLPHSRSVFSAGFHPNTPVLVTSGNDTLIRIWDLSQDTPTVIKTFAATQQGHIRQVIYSPDGTQLATCGSDGVVRLWETQTYRLLTELRGHRGAVRALAFSPDGAWLATAGRDSTVRVWNLATRRQAQQLNAESGAMHAVAFSPQGKYLITGGDHGKATQVWNLATGEAHEPLENVVESIYAVAFSPEGKKLATGGKQGVVRVWDLKTGEEITTLKGHHGPVTSLAYASETQLVTGGRDQTVRLWDIGQGERITELRGPHNSFDRMVISPQVFSEGGKRLATIKAGKVQLWDTETGRQRTELAGSEGTLGLAFSPDGWQLATTNEQGQVRVWDVRTRRQLMELTGHEGKAQQVVFHPQGQQLASAGDDQTIRIWDLDTQTGRVLIAQSDHRRVESMVFAAGGQQLVTAGNQGKVKIWNAQTGDPLQELLGHQGRVLSMAFHPHERHLLATGGADHTVRLWNWQTGEQQDILRGHRGGIGRIAFSSNGQRLVTGGTLSSVRLWDMQTRETIAELEGHQGRVFSAFFGPDGRQLLTGGEDGTARLWDVAYRGFDRLLRQNCERIRFYLQHNPNVKTRDRTLCDGVPLPAQSERDRS